MKYSVQNISKTRVEIAFDVPKDEWMNDIKESYNKNKHKYQLKGFRKGKVPFHIAFDVYKSDILYNAVNYAVPKYYDQILEDEKDNFEVVGQPEFDDKEISEDALKMVVKTDIRPEFELGQYKDLEIEKYNTEVTDKEVEDEVKRNLELRARLVEVDRPVKDGDTVVLDFSGNVDGEKFEGGTAEKQTLVIGSKQFIPGFEDQLIGMKKGEEKDINVKFPEDYAENLAGKDAVFNVKIHEIKEKEVPKLDDEFVKDITEDMENVEQWKNSLKQQLEERKNREAENDFANKIIEKIASNTQIEIPESMIEDTLNYKLQQLERNLSSFYGMKLEDYFKHTNQTVEDFKAQKRDEAIRDVKYEFIISEIIKKEKIEFSKEEFDAELEKAPKEQRTPEMFNYIMNSLLMQKLFDFLKENNKLV